MPDSFIKVELIANSLSVYLRHYYITAAHVHTYTHTHTHTYTYTPAHLHTYTRTHTHRDTLRINKMFQFATMNMACMVLCYDLLPVAFPRLHHTRLRVCRCRCECVYKS